MSGCERNTHSTAEGAALLEVGMRLLVITDGLDGRMLVITEVCACWTNVYPDVEFTCVCWNFDESALTNPLTFQTLPVLPCLHIPFPSSPCPANR